ncbi:putative MFS drug efflux transporter [Nemania sp. NC0429]|nr:putative MFS drug efflux transporter [Nemania sp. NC0429]
MATDRDDHTPSGVSTEDTSSTAPGLSQAPHDIEKREDEEEVVEPPVRDIHGWKWVVATVAILSSIFLYALDATIVADIQPAIVREFDALQDISWLSVGFLFSATATNMVWGRVYSQFNSKWLYIFNVVLFEAGSALCGGAPNIEALIVGRVLCGIGGSGLYIGVMTLISITTSIAERPLYVSSTGITWGLGIVLGPVIGGALAESAVGWRWAFYINLFIGAAAGPAYLFLLPSKDPQPGVPWKNRLAEIDYTGAVLLIGCITSLIFAINFGGVVYAYNSGQIIALFVVFGVLLILLAAQQSFTILTTMERRLIPVQFFRSRTVLLLFFTTAASAPVAFVPIYFVPLFFQFTRNDAALEAGVRLLPLIVVLVFFIFVNGGFMARFGYYMPWYTLGGVLAVVGGALMYTVDQSTSESRIYGYTVLIGAGAGLWLQASFSVAQAVVAPENIPPAIGFITLAQFLGNAVSLAIANAIFLNGTQNGLQDLFPTLPLSEIQQIIQGVSDGFLQKLDPETRSLALDIIAKNVAKTYILVITAGAFVALLSLLMKREKLFLGGGKA